MPLSDHNGRGQDANPEPLLNADRSITRCHQGKHHYSYNDNRNSDQHEWWIAAKHPRHWFPPPSFEIVAQWLSTLTLSLIAVGCPVEASSNMK
jgi:hypothetical protein